MPMSASSPKGCAGRAATQLRRPVRSQGGENDSPSRNLSRFLDTLADDLSLGLDVRPIWRNDRFGRGGDHTEFLNAGFPAVRFSVAIENYNWQHQDLRTENGIAYGDTIERMDFPYLRKVTQLNVAALAALARAPMPPEPTVEGAVSTDTTSQLGGGRQAPTPTSSAGGGPMPPMGAQPRSIDAKRDPMVSTHTRIRRAAANDPGDRRIADVPARHPRRRLGVRRLLGRRRTATRARSPRRCRAARSGLTPPPPPLASASPDRDQDRDDRAEIDRGHPEGDQGEAAVGDPVPDRRTRRSRGRWHGRNRGRACRSSSR